MIKNSLVALVLLGACGSSNNTTADAPRAIDGPPPTIVEVTCPATPAATVTTSDAAFAYTPAMTTITQGQVVKFTMSGSHNVVPGHAAADSTKTDSGMNVGFGAMKCLMFTQTGTYGFHCLPHQFNGTITVQ
ncbi:MAG: hypothetical protein JWO36_2081 [Myxococcales bacterium]|nr:hypothetical protein [Myxococcales bacterium]